MISQVEVKLFSESYAICDIADIYNLLYNFNNFVVQPPKGELLKIIF